MGVLALKTGVSALEKGVFACVKDGRVYARDGRVCVGEGRACVRRAWLRSRKACSRLGERVCARDGCVRVRGFTRGRSTGFSQDRTRRWCRI